MSEAGIDKTNPMAVREAALDVIPKPGLLIGDKLVTESSGGEMMHIYPATGKATVRVPLAGAKEIDDAVKAARKAFQSWHVTPGNKRRDMLFRFSQILHENAKSLARLVTVENGTPIKAASNNPIAAAERFAYNAGLADKMGGRIVDTWDVPSLDYILEEPYGVIAVILPFNAPFTQFPHLVAPALAAGNCVVLKPSSLTPFTTVRLSKMMLEAGFPPGVVNVIPTKSGGGEILCSHPGVDKIHFTGSVETAKTVMALAAKNITPVAFELGGKSATIVFNDADLQTVAKSSLTWLVALAGQACLKGSRFLVQSGVYDEVVKLCTTFAKQIKVGDPALDTTMLGPVISEPQCNEILGFINRAKANNTGKVITGGERLGGELANGYFIAPTIIADVDNNTEICQEEVFGPVITITRFDTEEEAIRLANDNVYGLAGFVQTNDLKRAHRVAAQINAGNIWIPQLLDLSAPMPFGGYKKSGFGRVGGIEAIREFTHTKNIWVSL